MQFENILNTQTEEANVLCQHVWADVHPKTLRRQERTLRLGSAQV